MLKRDPIDEPATRLVCATCEATLSDPPNAIEELRVGGVCDSCTHKQRVTEQADRLAFEASLDRLISGVAPNRSPNWRNEPSEFPW